MLFRSERKPREGERRQRRRRPERPAAAADGAQPVTAGEGAAAPTAEGQTADATPPADGERRERHGRPRHRRRDDKRPDGEQQGEKRAERADRRDKRDRSERRDRGDRPERSGRPPRRDRHDDKGPDRIWASSQEPRSGGKEPDPNSPFAKLLALKEQLQGNKDR